LTRCVYLTVKTGDHPDGNGEDEGIEHRVDGLEDGDVLHEGRVPHEAEDEGADENGQHEDEKLPSDIILVFGLDKVVEHFITY
jgi:hypothetical protein